ncbi:unnamed protein product [Durusdinium trenchii]|uniref:Uncharacterized protein n=1 Tax=Durusdinium trenchii TaxID=1381693 RepID=A0ABP0MZH5_9DINO
MKKKKKEELYKYLQENTDYQDKVRFLFQVPLLKRLPLDQQPLVARAAKSVKFPPRTVIIKEGEMGDEFFVLRQGEASVTVHTVKGDKVVGRLGPGDYFGEKALLASEPRTATIISESFAECLRIHRQQFEELGLKEKLTFADRKAERKPKLRRHKPPTPKTLQEEQFIRDCLLNCENLSGGMGGLTEKKMQALISVMWKENVLPGRRLIRESDLGADFFYVVESGTFEVIITEKLAEARAGAIVHSKKTVVDVLKRGNTFGELAIIFLIPRRATVVCTSEASVWVCDRLQFKSIVMPVSEEKQLEFVQIFSAVPLLMPLLTTEKAQMAKVVVEVTYNADEHIVEQGAPGNTFFMLVEGKVVILRDDMVKGELEANVAKQTIPYFGERALLYQEPRAATVKVISESARCLMLDKDAFDEHLGLLREVLENALKTMDWKADKKKKAHHPGDPDRDRIYRHELVTCGRMGCGGYSTVDLVQHGNSGNTYALKSISKGYIWESQMKGAIANEKDVLYMTSSPFIIKLFETYNTPKSLCFLLEAALGGELFTVYKKHSLFGSEGHARFYAAGVAFALEHMHDRRIVYRDVKPENILLDHNGQVKLSDMGCAKFATNSTYTVTGTPDYFAPEMVKACGHDCNVDWWALGVLVFELLAGKPPFESAYPFQTFVKIHKGIERVRFPALRMGSAEDLIKGPAGQQKLLREMPEKRLPAMNGGLTNLWKQSWYSGFDHAAMKNLSLPAPYNPQVRSNRDLANFFANADDHPRELPYVDPGNGWDDFFASC